MKKLLSLTFTILASTYASSVCAEDSWYLGALYNAQEISIHDRDFNTAGVIAGYQYNKYLALEARLSKGTSGYSSFYGTPEEPRGKFSEDIDTQFLILIKASYPVFESFNLYGLAGYTKTNIEINGIFQAIDSDGNSIGGGTFKHTESQSGFSYGLGLNYLLNEQFNIFIDYQIFPDFETNSNFSKSWKSTTIGVSYSF